MKICTLILREALHRRLHTVLSLLAVFATVALFVAFFTVGQGAARETRRLMRDIGFNLRIVPLHTDMERFWAHGYSDRTMPQEYVQRLAGRPGLSYRHLSATLQRRISWRGREIVLTGVLPELEPPGQTLPPLFRTVQPGTAQVGATLAAALGLHPGDTLDVGGGPLRITAVRPATGSLDDIRVYTHLQDAQRALDLPGRINEIRALHCLCLVNGVNVDSMAVMEAQLAQVLPDTRVIRLEAIADARERQRAMMQRFFAFVMPLVVAGCLVWLGVLALLNVRERTTEIGLLRALGYGSGSIAALFLGRAALLGLLGAVAGYGAGTLLALRVGPTLFTVTAPALKPSFRLLTGALWMAPAFSALAAAVPALWAVLQDPARILGEG